MTRAEEHHQYARELSTSQNQTHIEADLRQSVLESLGMDDEALRPRLEVGIRNYDPCISCAAHFLRLTVAREP